MMNSPSLVQSDGFLELARLTWPRPASSSTASAPFTHSERLIELLAELLRAANNGRGAIEIKNRLTPELIAEIQRHPQFFVLEESLLQLPRYASHRQSIHAFFDSRANENSNFSFTDQEVRNALDLLLPAEQIPGPDGAIIFDNAQQRLAIAALVDAKVGILTGGPGTGKTTTAAAILALLKRLNPELRANSIIVTAPTGKAASRIAEAISKATAHINGLDAEEQSFLQSISAITLHKALEWSPIAPEKGGPFRRNAHRPLEAQLVLVDEASMIDLSLLSALVQALPTHCSLLLLGDNDQLESVEVGGMLAELVQRASAAALPGPLQTRLAARLGSSAKKVIADFENALPRKTSSRSALPGLVIGLKDSRRAMNAPWILKLAEIFRPEKSASFKEFESLLESQSSGHLRWHRQMSERARKALCKERWQKWTEASLAWVGLTSESPQIQAPLQALTQFQLLCSSNTQVDMANQEGLTLLWGQRRNSTSALPHGCPIIIEANNHSLGLSNGDVGVAIGRAAHQPASLALFAATNQSARLLPIAQLPAHRPAFALTIHKSQGSEWEHVAIELPTNVESALLSRNLLYTAITRSSMKIELFGSEVVLRQFTSKSPLPRL